MTSLDTNESQELITTSSAGSANERPSTPPTQLIQDEQLVPGPPALKRARRLYAGPLEEGHSESEREEIEYRADNERSMARKKLIRGEGTTGSSGANVSRGGNTRISPAKHWCFTWNNPPPNASTRLVAGFQGSGNRWVWQDEIGKEQTPHKQGYVFFEKKIRPFYINKDKLVVSTLGLDTKIHWEICKSPVDAIRYCSDPEKRADDGVLSVHRVQIPRVVHVISEDQLYDFQKWVVQLVRTDPDQRSIYWLWEGRGNVGKSSLARFLVYHFGAVVTAGKASDIKNMVFRVCDKQGVSPLVIICDIPRSYANYVSFTGIEEVKNGCFGNTKYECETVLAAFSHVICFANAEPLDQGVMSSDRWKIGEITREAVGGIKWK